MKFFETCPKHSLVITRCELSHINTTEINPCVGLQQYSFIYSQAAKFKFSIRESFRVMLETVFNASTSPIEVEYLALSREISQNKSFQDECALKMASCKRCLSVKNKIAEKHSIKFNFCDKHNFYQSIISICLHIGMFLKASKGYVTVKEIQ